MVAVNLTSCVLALELFMCWRAHPPSSLPSSPCAASSTHDLPGAFQRAVDAGVHEGREWPWRETAAILETSLCSIPERFSVSHPGGSDSFRIINNLKLYISEYPKKPLKVNLHVKYHVLLQNSSLRARKVQSLLLIHSLTANVIWQVCLMISL